MKKILKKYYIERKDIIHHRTYMDEDLRCIEGYSIFHTSEPYKSDKFFKLEIQNMVRNFVKNKTKDFNKLNLNIFSIAFEIFDILNHQYKEKKLVLNTIYKSSAIIKPQQLIPPDYI